MIDDYFPLLIMNIPLLPLINHHYYGSTITSLEAGTPRFTLWEFAAEIWQHPTGTAFWQYPFWQYPILAVPVFTPKMMMIVVEVGDNNQQEYVEQLLVISWRFRTFLLSLVFGMAGWFTHIFQRGCGHQPVVHHDSEDKSMTYPSTELVLLTFLISHSCPRFIPVTCSYKRLSRYLKKTFPL